MTCFFFHDWKPVAANTRQCPVYKGEFGEVTGELQESVFISRTDILYKCVKCSEVKQKVVNGRWTLKQVRGEESA